MPSFRATVLAAVLAVFASGIAAAPALQPSAAQAAPCVRFSASNFNASGSDNYSAYLNGEWVRVKNYCSTSKDLSSWRIHEYRANFTYRFASGVRIGAGSAITLYSGRGTNTSTKKYWGRTYGAIWNNSAPEFAYLKNAAGTLQSRWTEY